MLLALIAVLLTAACASDSQAQPPQLTDPRCEFLRAPLGIDTLEPRFGWKLADPAHTRGLRQTAYQIRLAGTPAGLADARGRLWDSGKVASGNSTQVAYAGAPLKPGKVYWWQARAWLSTGATTAWSAPARFSVGPLTPADWQAKWIGMEDADGQDCPWFRTEFDLKAVPAEALAAVGSIGYHELYVNGRKADDGVLNPSVSDLRKRALYRTYDVKRLLRPGRNAIAIWAAPGWSPFQDGNPWKVNFGPTKYPLCIAQLMLMPARGNAAIVGTDATWRCSHSTTRHLGAWHNGDFGGDEVDANKDQPGWNRPGFDDSAWARARIYDAERMLSPDLVEPNKTLERIPAAAVRELAPGKYRLDLARLCTGWIEATLKAKPGARITLSVSSHDTREVEYNMRDVYVMGPSGRGTFRNRFSYHECRYITIEGLDEVPATGDVCAYHVTNDRRRIGTFACSNPLLQRIHDVTLNTYLNLTTGGMTVDCPHRERLGYGGDGHTSMEIATDTLESNAFFRKWAQDWCDNLEPNGRGYHTAPTMGGGGGPGWTGFMITMPWEVYLNTGDKRILERSYPYSRRWLNYIQEHVGADGLVQPLPGGYWMFLGDWATPHGDEGSDTPDALLFNNCYMVYVLGLQARIATLLGHPADARECSARAQALGEAINRKFYHADSGQYLNGKQVSYVTPLISGAVPSDRVAPTLAGLEHAIRVEKDGHLDTGLHGTYFMTKYLYEHGRNDLIYTYATQTTFPSYGELLSRGLDTWPEYWRNDNSLVHGCLNGIGGWFQRGIAGLRTDAAAPGYAHFIVHPAVVGNLTWAKATHESPYGLISTHWWIDNSGFHLDLTVPPNSRATVYLPGAKQKPVAVEAGVHHFVVKGLGAATVR